MGGILVYALHDDEGEFNNNSLGAISEAARLAGELELEAVVVGDVADDACRLGSRTARRRSIEPSSVPEAIANHVDVMAKVIADDGPFMPSAQVAGLSGFEIGAGLTARLNAGVTMEVTAVKAADGKLVADVPCSRTRRSSTSVTSRSPIIIGRLNCC